MKLNLEMNTALSAEVLEIIFRQLSFRDLHAVGKVCKFWAAVAERPQLWAEFKLVINQNNHTAVESMLSWRKFRHLKTLKIMCFSERVVRAVRRHQKIQRLHFSELTHHSFNHKRVPSLGDCILEKPLLSEMKELIITSCYLPCRQLWKILSAIFEGRSPVEKLELGDIGSDECSNYHDICPVPARMLGQAASRLKVLSIQDMPFNASQLEAFFKAFSNPDSLLEELKIFDAPNMVDLDPATLAKVLAIPTLKRITLNAVNLGLLQTQLFLEQIRQGRTNLKELSINFDSFNNRDNNNPVRKVEAFLLAGALNQLEKVKLGNVNLSGTQVEKILSKSREKTKLRELWVDRYDADRSHIFLGPDLTNNLPFDFHFNNIQYYVKWEQGWKTTHNGAYFGEASFEHEY